MKMAKLFISATTMALGALYAVGALSAVPDQTPPPNPETAAFFEAKVRPILFEHCFGCHGEKQQSGGVRLDSPENLGKAASSGPILTPGDPERSALIRAIRYDGRVKMPPTGKLQLEEIAVLTEWVKMGAPWPAARPMPPMAGTATGSGGKDAYVITPERRNFWSFRPVKKPTLPTVKDTAWVQSPLDRFILAKLEAKGLKPAPPADRRTLIRRAYFDLIGLPPTPEEVDAFLADRSPNAFAKVVDRLLASPRYGERWGRHWLDVVRYADALDSRGLGGEGDISEAWRYRDWVVDAFNRDLPYDQFVMNQIAGDLLPSPDGFNRAGTIATGMLAIGNWGNGDADKDKILTDIADDQVDVVSRGFMGLTVACARCHDHKFDPIPTRDYYGLAGIFFSTHILPKLTPKGAGETPLRIPLLSAAEKAQRDRYATQLAEAEKRRKEVTETQYTAFAKSLLPQTARYLLAAWDYKHPAANAPSPPLDDFAVRHGLYPYALRQWMDYLGMGEYRLMTNPIRDLAGHPGVHVWHGVDDCPSLTVNTTDKPVTILTFTLPPKSVAVHPGPSNGVAVTWRSPIQGTVQVTGGVIDADPNGGDGIAWILDHGQAGGTRELASGEFPNGGAQEFAQGKSAAQLTAIDVKVGEAITLLVLPKENYGFDTTTVHWVISQKNGPGVWDITRDLVGDPLLGGKGNPHPDSYGHPAVWSFLDMANSARAIRPPGAADPAVSRWLQAVDRAAGRDDVAQAASAFAQAFTVADARSPFYLRSRPDESSLPPDARAALVKADAELAALQKAAPPPLEYANGVQEGGCPESPHAGLHDVRVHIRGSYARLGDLVPRHFPIVLGGDHQPPITQGSGRLQLAQWLVRPDHPLTARVFVNRVWQHHFGEGIVRTPSNFGFLGERPTHPELLDWLAATFMETPGRGTAASASPSLGCGWSIKKLHRLILLSSTYQQASVGAPATEKADPDNRLLGRMSRRRLEGEAIRDNLLAVSGSLDTKMGGPATREFSGGRRTLYIMTVRSDRSGFAPLFDVADSTTSIDRRTVSTVAPQALFLFNSPFALAQAQTLARRLVNAVPNDEAARIRYAYTLLYSRPATAQEIRIGMAFLARARQASRTQTAVTSAPDPDLRAWEEYSLVLLCANEFIYID